MSGTWIWERINTGNGAVMSAGEYKSEGAVRRMVHAVLKDCDLQPVVRRGISGFVVKVCRGGPYVDTGHWIYPAQPEPVAEEPGVGYGAFTMAANIWEECALSCNVCHASKRWGDFARGDELVAFMDSHACRSAP